MSADNPDFLIITVSCTQPLGKDCPGGLSLLVSVADQLVGLFLGVSFHFVL